MQALQQSCQPCVSKAHQASLHLQPAEWHENAFTPGNSKVVCEGYIGRSYLLPLPTVGRLCTLWQEASTAGAYLMVRQQPTHLTGIL
jgi:hypothetical protein